MLSQLCGRLCANASFAVEQQLFILGRSLEAVHLLEILLGDVEALHCRCNGNVDCARNLTRLVELGRFSDVYVATSVYIP